MNIRIKQLTMQNFKCFRDKEITFDSDITTIRGRNGEGKTTIADAILWCLFGKNTQGQSDFDLKTHGEDGKPIPHLDHSVEMELSADDSIITLKRTLKETWVKKRGSAEQVFKNNTTEYLVNGDVMTAADYKKYIASLVSEEVFKAITNPSPIGSSRDKPSGNMPPLPNVPPSFKSILKKLPTKKVISKNSSPTLAQNKSQKRLTSTRISAST